MATRAPYTVKMPSPAESEISISASYSLRLWNNTRRTTGENTNSDVTMDISTYLGSRKVAGGVSPSSRSRKMPPPTAVVTPSTHTPKISIFFFSPVIAPERANDTVPTISRIRMNSSMTRPP